MSRGGLFIRTRDPRPVGTVLNLEIRLQTGETVVKAQGVVRWVQAAEAAPTGKPPLAPGMGVQFTELDDASRVVIDRMVSVREKRGVPPGAATPATPASTSGGSRAPVATPPPLAPSR